MAAQKVQTRPFLMVKCPPPCARLDLLNDPRTHETPCRSMIYKGSRCWWRFRAFTPNVYFSS